jgi:2-succinyl-5-enolpyruvyl-6-hydroxy-3-cyclohexene-1-carboxylate synthase
MQQHVHSIAITCGLLGIKHVVISPGSRSAPLVLAFARHKNFVIQTAIDERSAAYMALGMAQQKQRPVILICTSGTAAANYYPAVAEAFYQKIPLLVLTADRPEELLDQQDGQMINQHNLYGHHVRGFYQLSCYSHGTENHRETTAMVSEAIGKTSFPAKGPVHINVPLKGFSG